MLAGRVPGLQEKIVDVDFVDGVDGRAGVGVSGEQRALGVGINLLGFIQEADAIHVRHTLIGQQQRYRVVSHAQLAQDFQPGVTRVGA